jgi:hypothetical protein
MDGGYGIDGIDKLERCDTPLPDDVVQHWKTWGGATDNDGTAPKLGVAACQADVHPAIDC